MSVPRSLLRKSFLFGTIAFIVIFSGLFLFIYKPYSDTFRFSLRDPQLLLPSVLYYAISIAILSLSKGVVLIVQKTRDVVIGRFYVVTVLLEWIALSALYVLFAVAIVRPHVDFSLMLCGRALFCIASILAIPYTICVLFAANKDKEEELAAMKANVEYSRITSQFVELTTDFIDFRDNGGALKLTLEKKNIYYIESQDNYVSIVYEIDGRLESYLLRCKTKDVVKMLSDTGMIRCHRSYLVNPEHIKSLNAASGGRARIVFDKEKVNDIPVSKTYAQALKDSL